MQRVVIIGGVALGPKAACRFKRLEPESEVIILEKDRFISYGGCGIPFYLSGEVSDIKELQSTSYHVLRDENFFEQAKGVKVLTQVEAQKIDRNSKKVLAFDHKNQEEKIFPYDKLVLATGAFPRKLNLPGIDLENIYAVKSLGQALKIREKITQGVEKAVVIGAGFIGLEIAYALTDLWGIETSIVEISQQILPGFISPELAQVAQKHLQDQGVNLYLSEQVLEFKGENSVKEVITNKRTLSADLVILATGVIPDSRLAKEAGLKTTSWGGVIVNEYLQTSDPNIYAGGDVVALKHLITQEYAHFPLGSLANRQGRVIGSNLAGYQQTFAGACGTFILKLFDLTIAGSGLSLERAKKSGFKAQSGLALQFDKAHFYPEKDLILLELVVEEKNERVLGIQGISSNGDSLKARIDAVASLLPFYPTLKHISNLEVAYSPPYAAAMDIVNVVANVTENILENRNRGALPEEVKAFLEKSLQDKQGIVLDCRGEDNAKPWIEKYGDLWLNIPAENLRANLDKIPRDKEILLVCNTGARSYEAQLILNKAGFKQTKNVLGGMGFLLKYGLNL
ncbi:MAG: hypothetical protein PWR24_147 [Desulfonauticus sp.]|nr:hypothetical protein [Desulfonauticus sp.]